MSDNSIPLLVNFLALTSIIGQTHGHTRSCTRGLVKCRHWMWIFVVGTVHGHDRLERYPANKTSFPGCTCTVR